ncbi:MAG: pyridoxal phosphate-dependent aminotransferase [Acidobacteria bacterium]|nr:pyridoxal phosphate-dependent aminotransferase [Acidobacteriota bacterium]
MRFREIAYMSWAKAKPRVSIDLARSGIEACPASLLRLKPKDFVTQLPAGYGWPPLLAALGSRYGVAADRVFTVAGGTSLANFLACATALDGARRGDEVIVERPTYEPLLRIPESLGCRIVRLPRRFEDAWAIDLDRFASLVSARTRLAIVTNLHNPSGMRIDPATLREMARILKRVGAHLLVDEVYLECLFDRRVESSVHAGPNVVTTNSLTKAYGLDGLRAGWILGPRDFIRRAGKIHDLLGVNGVAPGEVMHLAALRRLAPISRRAHAMLDPNLAAVRRFLVSERRLEAHVPPGGNVLFARLPKGLDAERFADRLRERYSTLVVPGSFFESPRFIRVSFGVTPARLARGLGNISGALDEFEDESGLAEAKKALADPKNRKRIPWNKIKKSLPHRRRT